MLCAIDGPCKRCVEEDKVPVNRIPWGSKVLHECAGVVMREVVGHRFATQWLRCTCCENSSLIDFWILWACCQRIRKILVVVELSLILRKLLIGHQVVKLLFLIILCHKFERGEAVVETQMHRDLTYWHACLLEISSNTSSWHLRFKVVAKYANFTKSQLQHCHAWLLWLGVEDGNTHLSFKTLEDQSLNISRLHLVVQKMNQQWQSVRNFIKVTEKRGENQNVKAHVSYNWEKTCFGNVRSTKNHLTQFVFTESNRFVFSYWYMLPSAIGVVPSCYARFSTMFSSSVKQTVWRFFALWTTDFILLILASKKCSESLFSKGRRLGGSPWYWHCREDVIGTGGLQDVNAMWDFCASCCQRYRSCGEKTIWEVGWCAWVTSVVLDESLNPSLESTRNYLKIACDGILVHATGKSDLVKGVGFFVNPHIFHLPKKQAADGCCSFIHILSVRGWVER